jgi:hypothetical protein
MLSLITYPRCGFVALEVVMEPEDLDAVLERRVPAYPADVGTARMGAPVD